MPSIKSISARKNLFCFGIPLIVGLAVRITLFSSWLNSPFRFYHLISGLDMIKHVRLIEKFAVGQKMSLYSLIFYLPYVLSNNTVNPTVIIFIQYVLGLLTVLLVTYISLRLFGNATAAMISGILFAAYAPVLLYESFMLRENIFLFFIILSLAVILFARKRHFTPRLMFLCGSVLILPVLIRFSALLWTAGAFWWIFFYNTQKEVMDFLKRDNPRKFGRIMVIRYLLPIAGAAAVLAAISLYNLSRGVSPLPFANFPNLKYILSVGKKAAVKDLSGNTYAPDPKKAVTETPAKPSAIRIVSQKAISVLRAYEIPNNLNYYFLREKLFPLKLLFGPMLLLPLALTAMMILLFRHRLRAFNSLLFIYLICISVPIIMFVPLARYRLVLIPAFCVLAGYLYIFIRKIIRQQENCLKPLLIVALLLVINTCWTLPRSFPLREEDYISYARGLQLQRGNVPEVETALLMACKLQPESRSAVFQLSKYHLDTANFAMAAQLLTMLYQQNPDDHRVAINYAISQLGTNQPSQAEKALKKLGEPLKRDSKVNYYYHLGESFRLQRQNDHARRAYIKALSFADREKQRKIIRQSLERLPEP